MKYQSALSLIAATWFALHPAAATSQGSVPIRNLSAADRRTPEPLAAVLSVRQMANGGVMVNDPIARRVVVIDSSWSRLSIVLDSSEKSPNPYGRAMLQMIPYLADSSIRIDRAANAFLVIDATGKVVHAMAPINSSDFMFMNMFENYTDAAGNLLYLGRAARTRVVSAVTHVPMTRQADSVPILRSNFESRVIDTIAKLRSPRTPEMSYSGDGKGGSAKHISPAEPLVAIDDWAVLADGSIAIVRGADYHVEIVKPDGSRVVSGKLPFDWKRVSETEKAALIDSATKATLELFASESKPGNSAASAPSNVNAPVAASGSTRSEAPAMLPPVAVKAVPTVVDVSKPEELPDYYPPLRAGAAKADRDGNLWILPTTSAQSKHGELVYDVVNSVGKLFERVRIPEGRSVAGFGKNGVVYLMVKENDGWYLERTTVVH